ncbi:MAG: D-sedoheptulose 7-phosphate isomerase [Acidobacteria bacterium]|nr:D-sedoheptulose 7-phosphate isomerase [Acidobacteriota bacterium]
MIEPIRRSVQESLELKRAFFAANEEAVAGLARAVVAALEKGNKVILFGNGGSAADAQHIAAELVGRFQEDRRPLAAVALTTDTSILTALGNDYGFEQVFARQVRAIGRPGDIAVAISTSGNSPNVLLAAAAARELGLITIGLSGGNGGRLAGLVDHHVNVPHDSTARVQEVHIMIGHLVCELVERSLKGL